MSTLTLKVFPRLTVLCLVLIAAGRTSSPQAFADDVDASDRSDHFAARQARTRRQAGLRFERERADLTALGSGNVSGPARNTLRKYLRLFAGTEEAAALMIRSVDTISPRDFRPNDRVLGLLGEDGRLPAPPFGIRSASPWRGRLEKAWKTSLDHIRTGSILQANDVKDLRELLDLWKRAEGTQADRKRRLAFETHFRDLSLLVDFLEETRRADRLRIRLAGFPGGTVGELIEWILAQDCSVRPGTLAHGYVRSLSLLLVRHCDGIRDQQANAAPEYWAAQESSLVPSNGVPSKRRSDEGSRDRDGEEEDQTQSAVTEIAIPRRAPDITESALTPTADPRFAKRSQAVASEAVRDQMEP